MTETHKADSKDAKAAAEEKPKDASGNELTFETYEPKGEKIQAHLADKTGTIDTVAGPVGYKVGDLIVQDTSKSVPGKTLCYIIPAEAAVVNWQKSADQPAAGAKKDAAGSHAEAAPANHTTKK